MCVNNSVIGQDPASCRTGPTGYPGCCRNWQWENSCIWDSNSSRNSGRQEPEHRWIPHCSGWSKVACTSLDAIWYGLFSGTLLLLPGWSVECESLCLAKLMFAVIVKALAPSFSFHMFNSSSDYSILTTNKPLI